MQTQINFEVCVDNIELVVLEIIRRTAIRDVHTSAGEKVNKFANTALKLGADSSDLSYQRTSYKKLMAIKKVINK